MVAANLLGFFLKDHNFPIGLFMNFWVLGSISSSWFLFISIYSSYIYFLYIILILFLLARLWDFDSIRAYMGYILIYDFLDFRILN